MKRSTRKVKWQHRGKDYAVGMIIERGKPPLIVVKFRKGSDITLSIDTVPSSYKDESEPASKGPMFQLPAESAEAMSAEVYAGMKRFMEAMKDTMKEGEHV